MITKCISTTILAFTLTLLTMDRDSSIQAISEKPLVDAETAASQPIDSVSGASKPALPHLSPLSSEEIQSMVNEKRAVCILSTTNPNGSPHTALIHPVFNSGYSMKFASSLNQTRKNIDRTKIGVLTVFPLDSATTAPAGARITFIQLDEINEELRNTKGLRVIYMQIDTILPLE